MNPETQTTSQVGIDAITNKGEYLVCEVRKHPLGIIYVFIQAIIGFAVAGGLLLLLLPDFLSDDNRASTTSSALLVLVFLAALMLLILMVATYLYTQNKIIVTNKNVTQVIQRGLFSRKVSELSLGSVEDVTADKHGIMGTIFDYGDLRIETAGEQNNFHFSYCPRPNYYGQQLLDARQNYHETHGDQAVS